MLSKFLKLGIIILLVALCFSLLTNFTLAKNGQKKAVNEEAAETETTGTGLEEAAKSAGLGKPSIPGLVGNIIQIVLSSVGVIFLILMVYGGFLWMTAGGNEEKVTKAKRLIMHATIGMIIVIGAYALTYYITSALLEAAKVE